MSISRTLLAAAASLAMPAFASAVIVNVDINGARNDDGVSYVPATYVGVGAFGTTGTVFNAVLADVRPTDFDAITVGGTNFQDEFGAATTIDFSASLVGGDTAGGGDNLVNDYIFNNGSGTSNVGTAGSPFTLSGLIGASADLFFYQPSIAPANNFVTILGGTNGNQGVITTLNGFTGRFFDDVAIVGGNITGTFADLSDGDAETAVIPGFSIQTNVIPEPAALSLLALGSLAGLRRRR